MFVHPGPGGSFVAAPGAEDGVGPPTESTRDDPRVFVFLK